MKSMSSSPARNTFQRDKYIETQTERGQLDDPDTVKMIELYETIHRQKMDREQDPVWQKNNMEYDLRTTDWILEKVRNSDDYACQLYAAMCNNDFIKNDVVPILKEETWSCSWRYAGGIIADIRETGDYIDWYCAGHEGDVTDEIRDDLLKLGWIVRQFNGFE